MCLQKYTRTSPNPRTHRLLLRVIKKLEKYSTFFYETFLFVQFLVIQKNTIQIYCNGNESADEKFDSIQTEPGCCSRFCLSKRFKFARVRTRKLYPSRSRNRCVLQFSTNNALYNVGEKIQNFILRPIYYFINIIRAYGYSIKFLTRARGVTHNPLHYCEPVYADAFL